MVFNSCLLFITSKNHPYKTPGRYKFYVLYHLIDNKILENRVGDDFQILFFFGFDFKYHETDAALIQNRVP